MKNLNSRVALVFAMALTTGLTAQAQSSSSSSSDWPKNEIEVRATVSVPSGEANFSGTNDAGSTLSFSRDFDFKNRVGIDLRYTYRTEDGKHKLLAEYSQTNWSRTTTLTRTFTFRGQVYVANAQLNGELKLRDFRGMYAYRWGKEKLRFGPMVDMGFINTRLDITGTTNSGTRTAEGSITKFAATIGYDLEYNATHKVNIFNNLGAIAFHHDRLFHTEGGVKVYLSPQFGFVGGYKYERYRWVNDDNFIRISAHGPFFGGVFRF